ncbi:helix-turn-helix domain-containing protein [Allostreptomyces psammosilenae]|uniref:Transcriptional regulator with XRE-family HTH domain n=1 Tax=Allostreptomyces psammosilenae TaxID=1892865 RepID=A0A853A6C3_9ACTN|nr:helix-turn-helix transcriptional regulator [Allostreptomyces psammosilenae]NYI06221.1 transcriptional regulator with XRE-family HTH domain [Allostreptomyces psammosilenae]
MAEDLGSRVSVVRQWQLAATLKRLREEAGLTQDQAVERLAGGAGRWSSTKLSRAENRLVLLKPRDVEHLLDVYGVVDPATREAVVQLAVDARQKGWWTKFGDDFPEDSRPFISMEGGLVAMRDYQNMLVNGLLQTADYARAVMNTVHPGEWLPVEVERRVAARMVRQHMFARDCPPNLHFIIDENVLDRCVGDRSVMRGQLRKLLDVSESPNVTIQVLPRSVGGGPGLEGPFSILTLPDPVPDVGYVEGHAGSLYIEDREHVRALTLRFGILTELALSRADSRNALAEAMKGHEK